MHDINHPHECAARVFKVEYCTVVVRFNWDTLILTQACVALPLTLVRSAENSQKIKTDWWDRSK